MPSKPTRAVRAKDSDAKKNSKRGLYWRFSFRWWWGRSDTGIAIEKTSKQNDPIYHHRCHLFSEYIHNRPLRHLHQAQRRRRRLQSHHRNPMRKMKVVCFVSFRLAVWLTLFVLFVRFSDAFIAIEESCRYESRSVIILLKIEKYFLLFTLSLCLLLSIDRSILNSWSGDVCAARRRSVWESQRPTSVNALRLRLCFVEKM